jgi:Ni/Fe-hydrogenase subunit HybB-like protein
MASAPASALTQRDWFQEKFLLGLRPRDYLKSLLSPIDLTIALILAVGYPIIVYRFMYGLGAVTNLSQISPWGLWIGFDMLSGIALAAGGYTIATTVHVFGMEDYHPIVRPAILTGFLGYLFAVIGLIADLGRPWNLWVPIVASYGTTSVMFEVAWCVAVYSAVLFLEFSPSLLEWLGLDKWRARIVRVTLGLTVLGMVLSTLHQSSLGALFLMAPTKLHPLWYSTYIPVFFFVSSLCAGIAMVMVESGLSHRAFRHRIDPSAHVDLDGLTLGLAKAGAVVLFAYFFLKLQGLADGGHWALLATPYGLWFLVEVLGFVLLPSLLFAYGARTARVRLVRWVAAWTVLGVVINRLNVSIIAMNWTSPERYVPSVMELVTSLTIITTGVMVYRWIVNRMPVLAELPKYRGTSH